MFSFVLSWRFRQLAQANLFIKFKGLLLAAMPAWSKIKPPTCQHRSRLLQKGQRNMRHDGCATVLLAAALSHCYRIAALMPQSRRRTFYRTMPCDQLDATMEQQSPNSGREHGSRHALGRSWLQCPASDWQPQLRQGRMMISGSYVDWLSSDIQAEFDFEDSMQALMKFMPAIPSCTVGSKLSDRSVPDRITCAASR